MDRWLEVVVVDVTLYLSSIAIQRRKGTLGGCSLRTKRFLNVCARELHEEHGRDDDANENQSGRRPNWPLPQCLWSLMTELSEVSSLTRSAMVFQSATINIVDIQTN